MDQPRAEEFRTERSGRAPDMAAALAIARRAIAAVSGAEVDAVSRCERAEDGAWTIDIETVESAARMGDNDLLAVFEVRVGADGGVGGFRRVRRYHRESDGAQ